MLNLVVYHPSIPQNTGNMMRTCVATNTRLHLIKPLGFEITDAHMKRAGMDYINRLDYTIYENWEDFLSKNEYPENIYYMSRYATEPPSAFDFSDTKQDWYFVVGNEHDGIDKEIMSEHLDKCMRLPMTPESRSLNVSNTAAIIIYEALRQQNYESLSMVEVQKGADFLTGGKWRETD